MQLQADKNHRTFLDAVVFFERHLLSSCGSATLFPPGRSQEKKQEEAASPTNGESSSSLSFLERVEQHMGNSMVIQQLINKLGGSLVMKEGEVH